VILYTNGDSHTAGAEAVNSYSFAEDDPKYWMQKRQPHPDNLKVAWSTVLASTIKATLQCDAESASSNARTIRTTKAYIERTQDIIPAEDVLMVIQWSTWEREEWLIDGTYFQVNASGIDDVPAEYVEQYKKYIADIDWDQKTEEAYQDICDFDAYLTNLGYKHIFFNGNNTFYDIRNDEHVDFKESYIEPYLPEGSFDGWLQTNGYDHVITSNYHYGHDAHAAWANNVLLKHIIKHKMV